MAKELKYYVDLPVLEGDSWKSCLTDVTKEQALKWIRENIGYCDDEGRICLLTLMGDTEDTPEPQLEEPQLHDNGFTEFIQNFVDLVEEHGHTSDFLYSFDDKCGLHVHRDGDDSGWCSQYICFEWLGVHKWKKAEIPLVKIKTQDGENAPYFVTQADANEVLVTLAAYYPEFEKAWDSIHGPVEREDED